MQHDNRTTAAIFIDAYLVGFLHSLLEYKQQIKFSYSFKQKTLDTLSRRLDSLYNSFRKVIRIFKSNLLSNIDLKKKKLLHKVSSGHVSSKLFLSLPKVFTFISFICLYDFKFSCTVQHSYFFWYEYKNCFIHKSETENNGSKVIS